MPFSNGLKMNFFLASNAIDDIPHAHGNSDRERHNSPVHRDPGGREARSEDRYNHGGVNDNDKNRDKSSSYKVWGNKRVEALQSPGRQ